MIRIAGISLGSKKRNLEPSRYEIGNEIIEVSREGTDGSICKFAKFIWRLRGDANAIGMGGLDLYVKVGVIRFIFIWTKILSLFAWKTPIVDGSGVKEHVEPRMISHLKDHGILDLKGKRVLMVSAVDRKWLAQAIIQQEPEGVIFGDLMFSLGICWPLHSYFWVCVLGYLLLPFLCCLPPKWIYPTGKKQHESTERFANYYRNADVIAGDFHFIKKYLPKKGSGILAGKVIITNTLTDEDVANLKALGVALIITCTPVINGRHIATNIFEAILVALIGKRPSRITASDYDAVLRRISWKPSITQGDER